MYLEIHFFSPESPVCQLKLFVGVFLASRTSFVAVLAEMFVSITKEFFHFFVWTLLIDAVNCLDIICFTCFIKFNYRLPQILWSFFCFPCSSESNISAALGVCQEPRNSLTFYTHKLITRKQITDWSPLLLKLSWYINIDHGHFGSFCCHYDLKRVCLIINGFSQPLIMIEIKVLYYQSYSLENGPKITNSATVCKLTSTTVYKQITIPSVLFTH